MGKEDKIKIKNIRKLWDNSWNRLIEKDSIKMAEKERTSSRFQLICSILKRELGHIEGIEVVEIGSGMGLNSLALALLGAKVTLVDYSEIALKKAAALFQYYEIYPTLINSDIFELDESFRSKFDVCMSFGLAEHFIGEQREKVFRVHMDLIKTGGVIVVSVPNRFCPTYRLWIGILRMLGRWKLPEVPFSRRELKNIEARVGAQNFNVYGTNFCVSINDHLLSFPKYLFQHIGLPAERMRLPDFSIKLIDNWFGYALLLVVRK